MSMFDRTFHPDEANQAFTTGRLLETGAYSYNPQDHHGPTLYYAAATLQKAAGNGSTASLNATLLRCTPLLFAVLAIVFGFLALKRITKRTWPAFAFAALLGTSPIFVFFATDFIQEMLLASFTMMMLWAGAGYLVPGDRFKPGTWALLFGIAAGLAFATKETSVLTFAAASVAAIPFAWKRALRVRARDAVLAVMGFVLTAILLYSSFASNWQGVYNAFIAAPLSYLNRAAGSAASQGAAAHVHPWWQHFRWLFAPELHTLSEWPVVIPVLAALFFGIRRNLPLLFAVCNATALAVFYSAIPYKTPWCTLQIFIALAVAAALALAFIADAPATRRLRLPGIAIFAALSLLSHGCGVVRMNSDPDSKRIPYNYASASPQAKELAETVIAAMSRPRADGSPPAFAAVALPPEDTWPLPFYLRSVGGKVGYWTSFGELEALAGLGSKPDVVVVPAAEGHLVQPLFPHLKNTKRFEMRRRVRVRAFW